MLRFITQCLLLSESSPQYVGSFLLASFTEKHRFHSGDPPFQWGYHHRKRSYDHGMALGMLQGHQMVWWGTTHFRGSINRVDPVIFGQIRFELDSYYMYIYVRICIYVIISIFKDRSINRLKKYFMCSYL